MLHAGWGFILVGGDGRKSLTPAPLLSLAALFRINETKAKGKRTCGEFFTVRVRFGAVRCHAELQMLVGFSFKATSLWLVGSVPLVQV